MRCLFALVPLSCAVLLPFFADAVPPPAAVRSARPAARQAVAAQRQPPAGMERQCKCAEIKPCKDRYQKTMEPCLDTCQSHITSLGGNFRQVKACFTPKESLLNSAMRCTERQHDNACSHSSAAQFVPKRYGQTLENEAMVEIDRMIGRMGLDKSGSMKKLISVSKKLFGCLKQCMAKRAGNCEKQLKCGLLLPSDSAMVQKTKSCALNNGFNTATAQQTCHCVANAGVKDLKSVCNKVVIS
ncbi:hypothetical protein niasHT_021443 [Heterodera trifolii]|uniref:Uncharacterized protein n=1 Tax=Heterodera trifolii TaxID=157864 RepID=A0ABD2KIS5_9BILA